MEDDIKDSLKEKRNWSKNCIDRRKKDGTIEQRKMAADIAHALRQRFSDHLKYCNCRECVKHNFKKWPWWLKIIHRVFHVIIISILLIGSAQAYTASWYGTTGDTTDPWKHVMTASGEHFNENALTGASWAFPLGSWVRVTNMANGRTVVVRINDCGPGRHLYRKGRIIDLTRGSFERLAALKIGVIKVKVKKLFNE